MRAPNCLAAGLLLAGLPLISSGAEPPYGLTRVQFLNPDGTPKTALTADLVRLRESIEKRPAAIEAATPYAQWVNEDAAYLITDRERAQYARLKTDDARDQFIERFWQSHPLKEEHYRRIVYANERFADSVPGWRTDRGRAYIVAGPPDEAEVHPAERTEVWKYRDVGNGTQLLLTFGPAK